MNKLGFGEKVSNAASFAVTTIAHVAIVAFASKTAMVYGYSVVNKAKHILATNGRIWNNTAHNRFIK
jgi:hypothetical protein